MLGDNNTREINTAASINPSPRHLPEKKGIWYKNFAATFNRGGVVQNVVSRCQPLEALDGRIEKYNVLHRLQSGQVVIFQKSLFAGYKKSHALSFQGPLNPCRILPTRGAHHIVADSS